MKYLLDVNVLVAHLVAVHTHHARTRAWVLTLARADTLLLSPWVEIGFLRVGLQARLIPDLATGQRLLRGVAAGAARIEAIADGSRAAALPLWADTPARLGDGHLAALAAAHGCRLATFDRDIPGACQIP